MEVTEILQQIVNTLGTISHELEDIHAVFQLELRAAEIETYQLQITGGSVEWAQGTPLVPTCTIQMSKQDFFALVQGTMNPTPALLTGRIKIKGDRSQLKKLQSILKQYDRYLPEIV
jgi:putative sterol carrier protein